MSDSKSIMVTGAGGFVGRGVCEYLLNTGHAVIGLTRTSKPPVEHDAYTHMAADLVRGDMPIELLAQARAVVHCAGRAHIRDNDNAEALELHRNANVIATERLARQAANAGVKRFVFMSSIGVNGNLTNKPFTEIDSPDPKEPYAISKYEAEQQLLQLAKEIGMEVVIIRPPLVYGPNAPGNFGKLVRWVNKGIPLPLGAIHNKRSFVALENLVSLITTCIDHPKAINEVFLVSDGEDVSTTEFLRRIATALDKPSRLLPVPQRMLELGLNIFGMNNLAQQLCGSLQVDSSKARDLLGWRPVISMDEQLKQIAGD